MEITRTHSRPTGISIIAVLLFIAAALDIVYGLLAMFSVPTFILTANAAFVVGFGLWTLRGWAFWAVVIVEIANLIFGAVLLFFTFNIWAVLLSMVIPAAILIYLFADSHVREAFHIG